MLVKQHYFTLPLIKCVSASGIFCMVSSEICLYHYRHKSMIDCKWALYRTGIWHPWHVILCKSIGSNTLEGHSHLVVMSPVRFVQTSLPFTKKAILIQYFLLLLFSVWPFLCRLREPLASVELWGTGISFFKEKISLEDSLVNLFTRQNHQWGRREIKRMGRRNWLIFH